MKSPIPFYLFLALGAAFVPQYSIATQVVETSIPGNIDWFVHLDGEEFRSTQTGTALLEEFSAIAQETAGEQMPINPVLVINGIRGLTLFGTMPDMANGGKDVDAVVVVDGTPELIQVFRGLISGFQLEKPEALVETTSGAHTILSMQDGSVHGSFLGEESIILSKSLTSLERYLSVKDGKAPHISLAERFPMATYNAESGLFFGAFVEGLKEFDDLPVQARILQLTQAVSVQLGESGEYLNLLASLATDSDTTAQQVQEVLKGILAIFILTQNGHPDVAALVESASVQREESTVTLAFSYPVESAVHWVGVLADLSRAKIAEKEAAEAEAAAEAAEATEAPEAPETDPAA